LISYQDLHGELGCPPRIKPMADGLYIIKLRSFSELGDANALDELPESDRHDFENVHKKAIEVLKSGLELFKKGNPNQAIRAFQKSVQGLELCRLKDEAEQEQQQATLIRLYTNLAVCYNKMEAWNKTCMMTKELKRLCDVNQKSKILFCEGRAQLGLGNFPAAREALTRCQRLEPRDKKVALELVKLNDKYQKYKENEADFSHKALQNIAPDGKAEEAKKPVEDDGEKRFQNKTISHVLHGFLLNDERRMNLCESLTESEAQTIKDMLVGPYKNMELTNTYLGDRKTFWLVKK
jgi:FK506-binding protein 6